MDDDRRRLESLNPEPEGGAGWAASEAGRRAYERAASRLDQSASLEPHRSRVNPWAVALPAVAVLLAIGLPVLLLRGGAPFRPVLTVATTAPTTTTEAPTTTVVPALTEWVFQGPVLDKEGVGPQLCSYLLESLPPQCQGVPVQGLDWADIPWAETAGDTTWADARLVGYFDGETFTLSRPPAESEPVIPPDEDPFATPCSEPDGGWVVTDPALATEEAFGAAQRYAEGQADYSSLWIDYLMDPPDETDLGPAAFVLNVRFTGDLAGHEAALREIYGGPLCVTQGTRTQAELEAILAGVGVALDSAEARAAGIFGPVSAYAIDTMREVVVATVFLVTEGGQAWADERWGPGLVDISGMLMPYGDA